VTRLILSSLVPGYEARKIQPAARFAPRAAGGAVQRLKTPGRVPEETRPYQAGDPVHLIDWHAFGRTDQLLVRQRREQAPQHVAIHLALHDSMDWPREVAGEGESPVTKAELAWRLAMFMAYAMARRGDTVEMVADVLPGEDSVWRPANSRMILDAFDWLRGHSFSTGAVPANLLPVVARSAKTARARRVILSDGMRKDGDLCAGVGLDGLRPGDLFVHVLSDLELTDGWRVASDVYTDEESGRSAVPAMKEWQGRWLSDRVPAARKSWLARIDATIARAGASGTRVSGSDPVAAFVTTFESWCGGAA